MAEVSSIQKLTMIDGRYQPYLTIKYVREHIGSWGNPGGWHAACTCGFYEAASNIEDAHTRMVNHLNIFKV